MRVLVADDEADDRREIVDALQESGLNGPDGKPYEVREVPDHRAALELMGNERFDVVVADMVMDTNGDEGVRVLHGIRSKSPIKIVLTAHPSIPDCVQCMRAGAWDYLEKNPKDNTDPYDNLLKSISAACQFRLEHPEAGRMNPDSKWVDENLAMLAEEHPGEIVAVLDGRIIDHGKSYEEVSGRVDEAFPYSRATLVAVPDTSRGRK